MIEDQASALQELADGARNSSDGAPSLPNGAPTLSDGEIGEAVELALSSESEAELQNASRVLREASSLGGLDGARKLLALGVVPAAVKLLMSASSRQHEAAAVVLLNVLSHKELRDQEELAQLPESLVKVLKLETVPVHVKALVAAALACVTKGDEEASALVEKGVTPSLISMLREAVGKVKTPEPTAEEKKAGFRSSTSVFGESRRWATGGGLLFTPAARSISDRTVRGACLALLLFTKYPPLRPSLLAEGIVPVLTAALPTSSASETTTELCALFLTLAKEDGAFEKICVDDSGSAANSLVEVVEDGDAAPQELALRTIVLLAKGSPERAAVLRSMGVVEKLQQSLELLPEEIATTVRNSGPFSFSRTAGTSGILAVCSSA